MGIIRMTGAVLVALLLALTSMPASAQQLRLGIVDVDPDNGNRLHVGGAVLDISYRGEFDLPDEKLRAWVARSAEVITLFYGRFPVSSARVQLIAVGGRGVKTGRAYGESGAFIRVFIGSASDEADLKRDWVMVHELAHLALPRMRLRHNWLSEGLAVYVESVARMRAGDLDQRHVWGEFVERMPYGVPGVGDRGLDFTPTWGRTYWGGAIFALVADIRIRQQTGGEKGLRDALVGIHAAGGNFEQFWPISRIIEAADAGTGETVLADLYAEWGGTPVDPDLPLLWRQLGVVVKAAWSFGLDDTAELASIRHAIGARYEVGDNENLPGVLLVRQKTIDRAIASLRRKG